MLTALMFLTLMNPTLAAELRVGTGENTARSRQPSTPLNQGTPFT